MENSENLIINEDKILDESRFLFKGEKKEPKSYKAHRDRIYDISFNCEGTVLATASGDSKVITWDITEGFKKYSELKGHSELVERLAWHPTDPHIIVSTSEDKTTKVWDIRKKGYVVSNKSKNPNLSVTWHPNGEIYSVLSKGNFVSFFEYGEGSLSKPKVRKFDKLHQEHKTIENSNISEISWDQTGNIFMVTGSGSRSLMLFDNANISSTIDYSLRLHTAACFSVVCDPSSRYIATSGADFLINILDSTEFAPLRTIRKIEGLINQMRFNKDGNYLATASDKNYVCVYDTNDGELIQQFETSSLQYAVAWHPRKNILAYAGEDKQEKSSKKDKYEGSFKVVGISDK